MKKYAVFDPENGTYIYYDSREEALNGFWNRVYGIALKHFHGIAYVSIEVGENGEEIWKDDCEKVIDKILSPVEIMEQIQAARKELEKNRTPVETLP